MRRLTRVPGSSLIVIVAPAGYGKSTLLWQWAAYEERRFLRVSLDRVAGGATKAIVDAVVEALEEDGCADAATRIRSSGRGLERLAAAIRLLGTEAGGFVLALDDAQDTDPAVLATALDALAGDSALAVVSRTEPPVALGGLRARRELTEIRAPDLAVTPPEAALLLRKAGVRLDFEAVQDLVDRTEGWPAGLYLAALSIQEQSDVPAALEHFGGEDHRVAEFLREEVMSSLSPELARFAVRSSVLRELAGPVCDAVLEQTGSAATLAELAAVNPFLRPVDPAHERFSWHPMLRQALAAELRRSTPELGPDLHRRAADWFLGQGDTDRAIDHTVSARDSVRAADLLWSNLISYLGRGRNELVQRWLSAFNPAEIAGCAPLALSAAYSHLMAGRLDQARHWLTVAAATREREDAQPEPASLAAGLCALEATLSQHAADTHRIAAGACQREPKDSPWRPLCQLLGGIALYLTGDQVTGEQAQARHSLEAAVELSGVAAPVLAALGLAQSAMIALEEKDWEAAADLADRAEVLIAEHQLHACPVSALAFAACAASRAHEGRADEAKRDLRTGIDLLAGLGDFIPWYGAEARILLALASIWLADIVGARSLLAEASRLARRTPDATVFQKWFDQAWSHMDGLAETKLAGPSSLTIAELRVLRFLPSHRSFREIGAQLGVSANTVKTQAHAVYRKLGAASRSEAVALASAAGLLGQ